MKREEENTVDLKKALGKLQKWSKKVEGMKPKERESMERSRHTSQRLGDQRPFVPLRVHDLEEIHPLGKRIQTREFLGNM